MPDTHSSSSGKSGNAKAANALAEIAPLAVGPTRTTLAHSVAVTDIVINVTSQTGFAVGMKVLIDSEIMRVTQGYLSQPYLGTTTIPVSRGQDGTVTTTHANGVPVAVGDAMIDFMLRSAPGSAVDLPGLTPWAPAISMGATDTAVPLPHTVGFSVVTLPVSAALTLALPTVDLTGALLVLVGNAAGTGGVVVASTPAPITPGGAAGHTVTVTAGQAMLLLAVGGNWLQLPTGTIV